MSTVPPQASGTLAGRRALVTGAGQGVGRGIALSLAQEGAALALLGRTEQTLNSVADEVRAMGGTAHVIVGDVREPADITRAVATTVEQLGGLDILVNNAQISALGTMLSVEDDAYIACWESGPLASFRLMRACYPHFSAGSVVINLGSGTSVNPMAQGRGVYSSAKAAIQTLSRTAGVEWGPDGIRVIAVLPAASSETAEEWARKNPDAYNRSLESIPMRRLGDPVDDIGAAVAFLCSPAASFVTATTIALDGGQAYLR